MKKLWDLKNDLSYLELEGHGRGIIMEVTRPRLLGPFHLVKWPVNPNILAASVLTQHHHSDHNSTKTPNSILSLIELTHTHSQHSTPWLTRLSNSTRLGNQDDGNPQGDEKNSAMQPKTHNNSPQSKTLCFHITWLGTTRKINPVQILH